MHNLCHRAFYTTGDLSHNGQGTGVLFGVFRDIVLFQERFNSTRVAFCFDSYESKRAEIYPEYKANRKQKLLENSVEFDKIKELKRQIKLLRKEYLPEIGYRNIFYSPGYEADDIIAKLASAVEPHDDVVVVSSDQDLYQLLTNGNVRIWQPQQNKVVTKQSFFLEYGILPDFWPQVKALVGCPGDNVPGAKGVGVKTAIKLLSSPDTGIEPKGKLIEAALAWYTSPAFLLSLRLVKLPFEGTPDFEMVKDKVRANAWKSVMKKLGMASMAKALPLSAKRTV